MALNSVHRILFFSMLLSLFVRYETGVAQETSVSNTPAADMTQRNTSRLTQLSSWRESFRPPRTGKPRSTGNGGSRDGIRCNVDEPFIQPLLPEANYGLTLSEYPKIYVNIPETSARQVLLAFSTEAETNYTEVFLPVPQEQGIVDFSLPETSPALELHQTYQWSLTFICDDYFTPNDPLIMGWIYRTATTPAIAQALAIRSPEEQRQWLSENGYWYDLIEHILARSEQQP